MPPYRLPLQLELHILELATPPLLMDHLAKRVEFLRAAALVHRSITPWAQQRLHDHFAFTCDPADRGLVRLKERLSAAKARGEVPTRIHLDLKRWNDDDGELRCISDVFVSLGVTVERLWIEPSHSSVGVTQIFTEVSHFILDDDAYRDVGSAIRVGDDGSDCASLTRLTHFALYNSSLRRAPVFSPTVTHVAMCNCDVSSTEWKGLLAELPNLQTLIASLSLPRQHIYKYLPPSVENLHRVEFSLKKWTDADLRTHRVPSHLPRLANFSFIVATDQPSTAARQTDKIRLLREPLKDDTIPPGLRVKYELRMADSDDVFDELMLEYGF